MQTFHRLREKKRNTNSVVKKLNELFSNFELSSDLKKLIEENPLVDFVTELSVGSDGQIVTKTNAVDKSDWNYKEVGKRNVGDSNFISSLPHHLRVIGNELLKHIRSIDDKGKLVQSETEDRFVNYRINGGRILRKDSWNFVAFSPQQHSIRVFLKKGDYAFLSGITLVDDDRYPYFKISDSSQLQSAKDAIELSYFYMIGWVE